MVTLLVVSLLAVASFTDAVSYGGVCDSAATCSDANTRCYTRNTCTKGICICNSGYFYYNMTSCVPEVLLGASCTSQSNCSAGTCTSGTCQCPSGQTASSDKRRCVHKDLDGSCTTVADCEAVYLGFPFSSSVACSSSKCSCISASWKRLDNQVCVWQDEGANCTLNLECYPGIVTNDAATCTSGKCTCPTVSGTKYVWKQVYVGTGRTVGACVHPSSQEVGEGVACTQLNVNDATARYCSAGHLCGQCPEDYNTNRFECLKDEVAGGTTDSPGGTTSSAGNIRASVMLLALLLGAFVALLN